MTKIARPQPKFKEDKYKLPYEEAVIKQGRGQITRIIT